MAVTDILKSVPVPAAREANKANVRSQAIAQAKRSVALAALETTIKLGLQIGRL